MTEYEYRVWLERDGTIDEWSPWMPADKQRVERENFGSRLLEIVIDSQSRDGVLSISDDGNIRRFRKAPSVKERAVQLVAQGMSQRQASRMLGISPRTIRRAIQQ